MKIGNLKVNELTLMHSYRTLEDFRVVRYVMKYFTIIKSAISKDIFRKSIVDLLRSIQVEMLEKKLWRN